MTDGMTVMGVDSLQRLGEILTDSKSKRPFLVADRGALESSGASKTLQRALAGRESAFFSDFEPNPTLESFLRAVKACREHRADAVVAFGGGTAIDLAKLTAACHSNADLANQLVTIEKPQLASEPLPLIAIPTTAGTGSEATSFAVLYVDGRKRSIAHPHLKPIVAIVDAALTYSCPPTLTATAGLDAFCQAIESFWSCGATAGSRSIAMSAARALIPSLPQAVNAPTPESREIVARAAHEAGMAINITTTTAPHALSYALTHRYGVPHGHAVALTFGAVMKMNAEADDRSSNLVGGSREMKRRFEMIFSWLNVANPSDAERWVGDYVKRLGLPNRLRDVGVPRDGIGALVLEVNETRLKNNPRRLSAEDVREIYESAW